MNPEVVKSSLRESYAFASRYGVTPHFAFKILYTSLRQKIEVLASWVVRSDKDFSLADVVQVFEVEFGEKLSWSQVRKILRYFSPDFVVFDGAYKELKRQRLAVRRSKKLEELSCQSLR